MKAIKDKVGNVTVLIQTLDDELEVVGSESEPKIIETSISEKVQSIYSEIKSTITNIADDIGAELNNLGKKTKPSQVEMEFNVGVSSEGKAGIDKIVVLGVSAKGEYAFKVKMIWDLKETSNK